jgi:hypothetical protein
MSSEVIDGRLKVAATIAFHFVCSTSVTLISKATLNGFKSPLYMLSSQSAIVVLLTYLFSRWRGYDPFLQPTTVSKLFG